MNRLTFVYVVAVVTAAVIILILQPWTVVSTLSFRDIIGALAFLGLGFLAEAMAFRFAVSSRREINASIAFLPILACATLFPATIAVAVSAILATFVGTILRSKTPLWIVAFN